MGDRSEAPSSLFGDPWYFADDPWDSASPWHGEGSPPPTHSTENTAQHQSLDYHPPPLTQPPQPDVPERLENPSQASIFDLYPPRSPPENWHQGTPSPQIIPEEIVFTSPSTPSEVSWNVLLSSESESHVPPVESQRSRRGRQPTTQTSQMPSSGHHSSDVVDLTQESSASPRTRMPSTSSLRGPSKRRRITTETTTQSPRDTQRRRIGRDDNIPLDVEEVDLRHVDDDKGLLKVLEEQRMATIKSQQEQASKPVKLATLSCVICMESMADVTATYCGHLFCHKCLMEALIAGENQGPEPGKGPSKCPVCRKKIKRPGTTNSKKDAGQVVALEIKVRRRDDKGKRRASRNSTGIREFA